MVKIGIVGCGAITKYRHAPELLNNNSAIIAGFYDIDFEKATKYAKEYNTYAYETYDEMLEDESIDGLIIATSNSTHCEMTIKALKANKHVMCEKPMATNLDDAKKMIDASNETKKYLMVGHNQRLMPAHLKAKELILKGEIGRVISFRTVFGNVGPDFYSAEGKDTWFFKKNISYLGAMGDMGIHKADLIKWLLEDDIEEVMAYTGALDKKDKDGKKIGVNDNGICILKTKNGVVGSLNASWSYYGEEENSTVIYGELGVMHILQDEKYHIILKKRNGEIIKYDLKDQNASSGISELFVKSIKENTPPEISGQEVYNALKVIVACDESAKNGCVMKV